MNVLHVCRENPERILGGRGIHIKNLLPELRKAGINALLLTEGMQTRLHDEKDILEVCPAHTVVMRDAPVNYIQDNWFFYTVAIEHLHDWHFDIVHIHDSDLAPCAMELARFFEAKLVSTIHLSIRRVVPGDVIPTHYILHDLYEQALLAASQKVILCSKYYAQEMQSIHRFDYPIAIVPNGVNESPLQSKRNDFTVFYAGRIAEQKGIKILIDAIKQRPDIHWIISGKVHAITREAELTNRAWSELLNLTEQYPETITLTGHLSNEEVLKIGGSCHAWIAPSLHAPFEIVGLEAMMGKTPFICTRTGGFLEYADDENCWFIEPHPDSLLAAIEQIRNNPFEAQRRVDNAFRDARTFTWKNVAKATKAVYESL